MELLDWELNVLSRCVAYKNLSGASSHVGLSQPQLSRIINKIEEELDVVLLDRGARRKSGWTSVAMRLAELYSRSRQQLEKDIISLTQDTEPKVLRIASLEGLYSVACEYAKHFYTFPKLNTVELDVHDTSQLEEGFFKGHYDIVFSSREPGRKKYKYVIEIGRQSLDEISTSQETRVLSTFQYHSQIPKIDKEHPERIFVSNSLEVRRHWVQDFGGVGTFPSEIRKQKQRTDSERVLLIGNVQLSPRTWQRILEYVNKK